MHHWKLTAIILILTSLYCDVTAAAELFRIRNLEEGKRKAKSEAKDLFILFTGNGSCYSCIMLDRKILQKQEFVDTISKEFVFVEFVFTSDDTPEEKDRNARLRLLQDHYLTPAVPTAILANCDGIPYAFITGYEKNTELQGYLNLISAAQSAKTKRDALFSAASQKSGTSRASLFNDGLQSIAPQLGKVDERGEDSLLHFYGDTVQEIFKLTDNQGRIANKYMALRNSRDAWIADNAVFEKLKSFESKKDYAGAVKFIAESLKTTKTPKVRWQLERTREAYLEVDDQFEQALAHCQRIVAMDKIPEDTREAFLNREAFNLIRLNRLDEALAQFDRRLQAAGSDQEKRLKILSMQVLFMLDSDQVEKSIEVCQKYREVSKQGTEDWMDATYNLARELRRAGRHIQALKVINEFLQEERSPNQLLDAAESLIALKRHTEAAELLKESRPLIQSLKTSHLNWDVKQYQHISDRIQKLTKSMSQQSTTNNK